jgi:hypothetical protein
MMKSVAKTLVLVGLMASPALADEQFDLAFGAYTVSLAADCASFDGGEFDAAPDAVLKVADVNGDGRTDPIVDIGAMSCSSSATLTGGGSGGRPISVFVSQADGGYQRFEFLGEGMLPLALGPTTVLIVPKHGSTCDLVGSAVCYSAYVWGGDGFVAGGDKVGKADD